MRIYCITGIMHAKKQQQKCTRAKKWPKRVQEPCWLTDKIIQLANKLTDACASLQGKQCAEVTALLPYCGIMLWLEKAWRKRLLPLECAMCLLGITDEKLRMIPEGEKCE